MTYTNGSKTGDLWFICPLSACINHLHTSHNRSDSANQRAVFAIQFGFYERIVSHTEFFNVGNDYCRKYAQ